MLPALLLLTTAHDLPAREQVPAREQLFVQQLEALSIDEETAKAIDAVVVAAAAEVEVVDVISTADLSRVADIDATRALVGCDQESCLAELAGALGARLILFGSVSRLGDTTTIALSLYDAASVKVARDQLVVRDMGEVPRELPPRVRRLVGRALGLDEPEEPPPSALLWAGAGVLGVGAVVLAAGGAAAIASEAVIQDKNQAGSVKESAQLVGLVGLGAALVGAVASAAGAALVGAAW